MTLFYLDCGKIVGFDQKLLKGCNYFIQILLKGKASSNTGQGTWRSFTFFTELWPCFDLGLG